MKRIERDSLGEVEVPERALYGAQTQRAVDNFPDSGRPMPIEIVRAVALIKWAAARTNCELGLLDERIAGAIATACDEVVQGKHDDQFPIDVLQTGSGTSSNMNVNEVVANRGNQLLGGQPGAYEPIHPNNHVNLGQSSNDVIPSAIGIASALELEQRLLPSAHALETSLRRRGEALEAIVTSGRTHLQDAPPIRFGQVFEGFTGQLQAARAHVENALHELRVLPLGGTAVGTGLNTHVHFAGKVAERLSERLESAFRETDNHFALQGNIDVFVRLAGTLKSMAVALAKVANDLRWLGSGPRFGLGDLQLPALQPGSSIMPGKVNPVIAESTLMACAQVVGLEAAVTTSAHYSNFQLNTTLPLTGANLLDQTRLLTLSMSSLREKLVDGLTPNAADGSNRIRRSLALATALAPAVGYDRAAEIAKEASKRGTDVYTVAREHGFEASELDVLLDAEKLTHPGFPGKG